MTINIVTMKGGTGLYGTHAYSIELDCYLAGLMAAYQGQCRAELNRCTFRAQLTDYIARGGHVHVAVGSENQVLGWAGILIHPSNQLLENIYLVERIIVDEALGYDEQCQVASSLIRSLIEDVNVTLPERHDDAWIMATLPVASVEASQALFTELAAAGFTGSEKMGLTTFILWRERSAILTSQAAA